MTSRAQVAGLDVSRETVERLEQLAVLLAKWNPAINLVSKSTLPEAWTRHIVDSAQLFRLALARVAHWVDLGSGGGFPGLVIAALSAELDPARKITLVESDQRKSTFLRQAAQALELTNVAVLTERIERAQPLAGQVVSARALAPLPQLCAFAQHHLAPDGVALFPKGAKHAEEVAEAGRTWHFDLTVHPSDTDSSAVVLELRTIGHV